MCISGLLVKILISFSIILPSVSPFPDQGLWSKSFTSISQAYFGVHKSLYAESSVFLSVNCEPQDPAKKMQISIGWVLRQTSCFEDYLGSDSFSEDNFEMFYVCPLSRTSSSKVRCLRSMPIKVECNSHITLNFNNGSFFMTGEDSKDPFYPICQKHISPIELGRKIDNYNGPIEDIIKAETLLEKPKNGSLVKMKSASKVSKAEEEEIHVRKKREVKTSSSGLTTIQIKNSPGVSDEKGVPSVTTEIPYVPMPRDHRITTKHGSRVTVVDEDGIYLFVLKLESEKSDDLFSVTVDVTMKADYGYLSAADFPLLVFYGVMCAVYVFYAFFWLMVSFLQWRDLLRIQFWIGGVILLGLIEKAVFYAEYQSINSTGQSVQGAVLFAEILSCLKRTLARMLVIIVSLGFGIVKPRLGPMLHRVVGVGTLYFVLGIIEGCLRVLKPKNDPNNQALMAGIPLAITDSGICWWIFSSLVQTIRTLRLRRNVVKLTLYQHFTNTLIFAVLASIAYMVWSIHSHKLVNCISDWKELWVDEAYWHLLFSLVLLVIMILWRPTNNNQRYAFTPLLDSYDDENDDDFDANVANDVFVGMKMRSKNQPPPNQNDVKNKIEEDLKWVEENIPTSLTETALPNILDSDEEIMTAKFERSKME